MDQTERERAKQWVENWKRAGLELEKIHTQELSQMTDSDTLQKIELIFSAVNPEFYLRRSLEKTSGLVEMQKLFAKHADYKK